MDKLERILNLTAALLDAVRPLTAEEIRSRVPGYPDEKASFRRQFERDKDELRRMGVPLRVEVVPGVDPPVDGYRIHKRDYGCRDPGLEADELAALHLATSMVRIAGVAGEEGLWKLGGATAAAEATAGHLPITDDLPAVFDAIGARHPIELWYGGIDRVVEPTALHLAHGRWYLAAHDRTREAGRSFRLDRVEGAISVDRSHRFEPRATDGGAPAPPWSIGDAPPARARIRVDADQATWVVQTLGPDAIATVEDDGSVVLELDVVDQAALRSFVLGFLEHAEVLEPPALRAAVVEWLEAIA